MLVRALVCGAVEMESGRAPRSSEADVDGARQVNSNLSRTMALLRCLFLDALLSVGEARREGLDGEHRHRDLGEWVPLEKAGAVVPAGTCGKVLHAREGRVVGSWEGVWRGQTRWSRVMFGFVMGRWSLS